ncbi:hypothetical protein [Geodermatophilus sp. SYSU D01105]
MSRRTVREAWLAVVLFTPRLPDGCRRVLVALALGQDNRGPWMNDKGRVRPVKHDDVGAALCLSGKTVANRIAEATKHGLLAKDPTTGYRGRPAAYQAQLPVREGAAADRPGSLRALVAGYVKVPGIEEPSAPGSREPSPPWTRGQVPGSREAPHARVTREGPDDGTPSAVSRDAPEQDSGDWSSAAPPRPVLRMASPVRRASA